MPLPPFGTFLLPPPKKNKKNSSNAALKASLTVGRTARINGKPKNMMTAHLSMINLGSQDCRECVLFQSFQPSWDFAHILPSDRRKCFEKLWPNQRHRLPVSWPLALLGRPIAGGGGLWGQVTEAQRGSQCSEADENKSQ